MSNGIQPDPVSGPSTPHESNHDSTAAQDLSDIPDLQHSIDAMLSRGWCTHQVYSLAKKCRPLVFSYLARLERLPPRIVDHRPCSAMSQCVAFNVNMMDSEPSHVEHGCACPTITIPYDETIAIIENYGVPLFTIEDADESDREPCLRVQERKRKSTYIAISHVWIDGLGNSKTNGLPACQLRKLRDRCMRLLPGPDVSRIAATRPESMLTLAL